MPTSSEKPLVSRPEYSPLSLARMLWKSKWLATALWGALCVAGALIVYQIPAVYRSETLVLVDSQKIPEKYVSATVSADVQDRLATISQQILSGTRLKKIIDDYGLYREERKHHVEEEILEIMRKDIEIRLERGWSNNRPGAFRIAYHGPAPSVAAEVANRLAGLYIEENLRAREIQAEGTSEFLDNQLREAKRRLDELEKTVSAYKRKYNGELPQQQETLTAALGRLQVELQGNQESQDRDRQARAALDNTLAVAEAAEAEISRAAGKAPAGRAEPAAISAPKRSELLQAQLDLLRIRYSDEHPDLRRLREDLTRFRESEAGQQAAATPAARAATPPAAKEAEPPDLNQTVEVQRARQRVAAVRSQIELLDHQIQSRDADRERILRNAAAVQRRLEKLPVREQEMAGLTRDYEISKANYTSLLDKKFSAQMATEMERRQKAERFTVLDPARLPEKPVRPNRPLFVGLSCLFGLMVAAGTAVGKQAHKEVFLGEWELPPQVPVLGRVPLMRLPALPGENDVADREARPRRWRRRLLFAVLIVLLAAAGVAAYFAGIAFRW